MDKMIEYVIGIDPDCKKSGLAFYKNEKLVSLRNWTLDEYVHVLLNEFERHGITPKNTIIIIEDANSIKGMYEHNKRDKPELQAKIAQDVGKIKMLATAMIVFAEQCGFTVIAMKPTKGNWAPAKMTAQFKQTTGWKKQSNPETRSAAFFGFLGIPHAKRHNRNIK